MQKISMKIFSFLLLSSFIYACGSPSNDSSDETSPYSAGEEVYENNCIACHQKNGEGVVEAFPPLAGSDYLLADKNRAIGIAANGMSGEITVNGVHYNSVMASQGLTHEEVRDVLNYILNSWGNDGGEVTLEEVEAVLN